MSALEDSLRAVYKLPQVGTAEAAQKEYRDRFTVSPGGMQPLTPEQQEYNKRFLTSPEGMQPLTPEQQEYNKRFLVSPGSANQMEQPEEFTEEDQETLDRLLQQASARSQAPLGELTNTLQAAGTGEDTILAHLTPGEIILAPQFMDDPEFEAAVERKFVESGLDPEAYVAGSGIANLNPQTGAPEYGFFKKIGKKLKKVVKKVAPIATFIPGVGTALGGVLGGIGSFATKIPGIGGALGSLGSTVAGGIAKLGIPGISPIAGGTAGGFGGIADALTTKSGLLGGGMFGQTGSTFMGGPEAGKGLANRLGLGSGTASQVEAFQKAQQAQQVLAGLTPEEMAAMDQQQLQNLRNIAAGGGSTGFTSNVSSLFGGGGGGLFGGGGGGMFGGLGNFAKMAGIGALSAGLGKLAYEDAQRQRGVGLTPLVTMSPTGRFNIEAEIARRMGQARPNPVEFGLLPEGTIPELSGGKPIQASLGGAIEELEGGMAKGMQDGGEMANRDAVKGAPPELLPKIAENVVKSLSERNVAAFTDEEVTMEIMRQLRPYTGNLITRSEVDAVRSMMNQMYAPKSEGIGSIMSMMGRSMMGRTPVMGFAQGGAVAMQDGGEMDPSQFPRMDGDINGPGTEQSDDIPAMLSDGEFVMTARAVRGAGSYEMKTEPGGIINLVPSLEEDRERGMDVMYKVMDTFSGQAQPS